jgi:hypothetical protein
MADAPGRQHAIHRRGRNIAVALFATIVTAFTGICATEIIVQAWAKPASAATVECRPGIESLISAIRRARGIAANAGNEQLALVQFRSALEPEWSQRPGLALRCEGDEEATQALGEVDRLRYAEEHALRYEALDVANRRSRVEAILRSFGGKP